MRSQWIAHNGEKIFYQDFSKHLFDSIVVKAELEEVQKICKSQQKNYVLVLTDM